MLSRSLFLLAATAAPALAQITPAAPRTPVPPLPARPPSVESARPAEPPHAPLAPHEMPTPHATPAPHAKPWATEGQHVALAPMSVTLSKTWSQNAPSVASGMLATRWYQGDVADSLYRAAYTLFARQEYRGAADRFADVRTKHPSTRYFCDAAYYEAFARYRLGTPTDLRSAYRVLDGLGAKCGDASRREDVPELQARIDGALARLGDADATDRVRRAAGTGQRVCDREERNVKIQALSALAQMDPEGARTVLDRVLATRDECSAPVRREALAIVARTGGTAAIATLARAARNDADHQTQAAALEALGRVDSDAAYAVIDEVLRGSSDERVQSSAAHWLAGSDSPRAQALARSFIERRDVSERLRASVISSFGSRGSASVDYWRSLYGKVESEALRRAIIGAVSRTDDTGTQFLLGIARSTSEPSSLRQYAVSRIQQTAPVAELYRLLESADSRSVRMSIVSGIGSRKEPETTDRLIDIAKRGTDPEVRAAAIRLLGQPARRDDPRVRQALADILASQP